MVRDCKGSEFLSDALSSVLECYSQKRPFLEGLEGFKQMRVYGYKPSIIACNALLDVLKRENEIKLAWSLYGAMIRDGVVPDGFTWSIIAQVLSKTGKLEVLIRLLDLGLCSSVIYDIVIDFYSKNGEIKTALGLVTQMFDKMLDPGFSTYSSVLNGACRYGDFEVTERKLSSMVEKKLFPKCPSSQYNSIIQKFCDLGKTHAAESFFKRACDDKVKLQDATYGHMLRALSKEGRVKEAIGIYREVMEKGITLEEDSHRAFANVLCKEDLCEERCNLLNGIIRSGYSPCAMELAKVVKSQCDRKRWSKAEDLVTVILERGLLPDSLCCGSLVEHYCSSRQIDKAIELHNKMEELKSCLDVETYNVLLHDLLKKRRVEEAVRVFDYMKGLSLVTCASFTIVIGGLCRVKELRKAMKLHDEMLKMSLKPDEATYKGLISEFK